MRVPPSARPVYVHEAAISDEFTTMKQAVNHLQGLDLIIGRLNMLVEICLLSLWSKHLTLPEHCHLCIAPDHYLFEMSKIQNLDVITVAGETLHPPWFRVQGIHLLHLAWRNTMPRL